MLTAGYHSIAKVGVGRLMVEIGFRSGKSQTSIH